MHLHTAMCWLRLDVIVVLEHHQQKTLPTGPEQDVNEKWTIMGTLVNDTARVKTRSWNQT
jgi:hypothetical protein